MRIFVIRLYQFQQETETLNPIGAWIHCHFTFLAFVSCATPVALLFFFHFRPSHFCCSTPALISNNHALLGFHVTSLLVSMLVTKSLSK